MEEDLITSKAVYPDAAIRSDNVDTVVAVATRGLTVIYGGQHKALSGFDFSAPAGDVTAVIGPNGSGKTTFLNALTGAVPLTDGRVILFGEVVKRVTPRTTYRLGVARTFQNLLLMDDLSVEDNVRLGAKSSSRASIAESLLNAPRARREMADGRRAAVAALERLGLADLRKTRTSELSYGDRRKVEIARALATSPRVLLLDEPTAGMGPSESAEFADLILSLAHDLGLCVVVVEHDMSVVRAASSTVFVLSTGRLLASGDPAEVLADPEVKRVYLGDFGARHA